MGILWLFLSHKGCLMALRLLKHEYLLAPMIWSDFYHFRISGSIICRQLLHSFTDVMKGASPFVSLLYAAFLGPDIQLSDNYCRSQVKYSKWGGWLDQHLNATFPRIWQLASCILSSQKMLSQPLQNGADINLSMKVWFTSDKLSHL